MSLLSHQVETFMRMMKLVFLVTILMLCISSANAQIAPPEYGAIVKIVSSHKVYIYTDNLKAYDHIAKALSKYDGLQVVSKIEESDFVLSFNGETIKTGSTDNNGYITDMHKLLGGMFAALPGSSPNSQRIVWHTEKSTAFRWGKDPEVKCTQEFIKAFQKAKGEKK